MNKKFRFWSKGTSKNLNFDKPGWISASNYILWKYHPALDIFESEDFVVQQYTGLLDKNNKEIFEGDILEFKGKPYIPYNGKYIGQIIFENGEFGIYNKFFMLRFCEATYVVIGNIFQNPELLENI